MSWEGRGSLVWSASLLPAPTCQGCFAFSGNSQSTLLYWPFQPKPGATLVVSVAWLSAGAELIPPAGWTQIGPTAINNQLALSCWVYWNVSAGYVDQQWSWNGEVYDWAVWASPLTSVLQAGVEAVGASGADYPNLVAGQVITVALVPPLGSSSGLTFTALNNLWVVEILAFRGANPTQALELILTASPGIYTLQLPSGFAACGNFPVAVYLTGTCVVLNGVTTSYVAAWSATGALAWAGGETVGAAAAWSATGALAWVPGVTVVAAAAWSATGAGTGRGRDCRCSRGLVGDWCAGMGRWRDCRCGRGLVGDRRAGMGRGRDCRCSRGLVGDWLAGLGASDCFHDLCDLDSSCRNNSGGAVLGWRRRSWRRLGGSRERWRRRWRLLHLGPYLFAVGACGRDGGRGGAPASAGGASSVVVGVTTISPRMAAAGARSQLEAQAPAPLGQSEARSSEVAAVALLLARVAVGAAGARWVRRGRRCCSWPDGRGRR